MTRARQFSPRSMRILYQVWCECEANGWSRPIAEVAEVIGERTAVVRALVTYRGWAARFAPAPRPESSGFGLIRVMDEALERLEAAG